MSDRLQRSGRNTPCPACGRTKDADCAFNHDTILCHQGSEARPTDGMRVGQTLSINGQLWALIRTNAGYSGCADLLKPHSERTPRLSRQEQRAQDAVLTRAAGQIATQKLSFLTMVQRIRAHIDPALCTLAELDTQQAEQEAAWIAGSAFIRQASILRRYRPELRSDIRSIGLLLKEINYQRRDTAAFRTNYLGEHPWTTVSI